MMFAIVSFLMHPVLFVREWRLSRRYFDKDGYPRPDAPPGPWSAPFKKD